MQARKMPGGRLNGRRAHRRKSRMRSTKRFGRRQMVADQLGRHVVLQPGSYSHAETGPVEVERVAAEAALEQQHIARVYTRSQLSNGQVQQDSISRAFTLGFFGPRSGDLFVLQEPYYLFDAAGTSHGTPYDYDNHVPVIFLGPGIKPGKYSMRIAVNDIAPTLAEILKVEQPPAPSDGS